MPLAADAGESFDYLLVTSSNLVQAFEPLIQRKTQDGLAVKVATLEAVTNSVPGRDAPERLRNYIRQAYTNWGISYVLLGGATSVIPCRDAYVRTDLPAQDSYRPCGLYYACLDGSWNANGDRHWASRPTARMAGTRICRRRSMWGARPLRPSNRSARLWKRPSAARPSPIQT